MSACREDPSSPLQTASVAAPAPAPVVTPAAPELEGVEQCVGDSECIQFLRDKAELEPLIVDLLAASEARTFGIDHAAPAQKALSLAARMKKSACTRNFRIKGLCGGVRQIHAGVKTMASTTHRVVAKEIGRRRRNCESLQRRYSKTAERQGGSPAEIPEDVEDACTDYFEVISTPGVRDAEMHAAGVNLGTDLTARIAASFEACAQEVSPAEVQSCAVADVARMCSESVAPFADKHGKRAVRWLKSEALLLPLEWPRGKMLAHLLGRCR